MGLDNVVKHFNAELLGEGFALRRQVQRGPAVVSQPFRAQNAEPGLPDIGHHGVDLRLVGHVHRHRRPAPVPATGWDKSYGINLIGSLTGAPLSALIWAMYADTADYSEWKTGRRATGLVFSASIMSNKLGWAIGSMIAGLILATTGFKANVVQNLDVQNGLKAMMSVIPVAIGLVALVLLFFYQLDESAMKKIKADFDERRKASETGAATA